MNDRQLKRTLNNALHSLWLNESDLAELVSRLSHLPPARRIAPLIGLPGVELDSERFHNNAIAFEDDRERDAETLANGFVTVRMTWKRIHHAVDREAARLQAILAQRAPRAA